MEELSIVIFYKACLIFGLAFSLLALIFGDFLDDAMDGLFDAIIPGDLDSSFSLFVTFLSVFGGIGLLLSYNSNLSDNVIIVLSILMGILITASFYFFYLKPMKDSENSVAFSINDLIGEQGEVTITIEPNKYGEVVIALKVGKTSQIAATDADEVISVNSLVQVDKVRDGVLYVSKLL